MKVIIKMDGDEAYRALEQGALLPLLALNKEEPAAPKTKKTAKPVKTAAPEKPAEPNKTEEPAEAEAPAEVTKEEVRKVLAGKSKEGKKAECKALLQEFGANRLPEVDPKDYAALIEKARAI